MHQSCTADWTIWNVTRCCSHHYYRPTLSNTLHMVIDIWVSQADTFIISRTEADDSAKKSLLVIFSCFPKLSAYRLIRDSILEKRCKCCVRWWPPHPRADLRGILGSLRGCTEAPSAGQQPPPQIGWTGHWSVHTLLFCYFFHLKILACKCMSDQNCIPLTFLVPRLDKSKLLLGHR